MKFVAKAPCQKREKNRNPPPLNTSLVFKDLTVVIDGDGKAMSFVIVVLVCTSEWWAIAGITRIHCARAAWPNVVILVDTVQPMKLFL
jgi:hypothetical protein